MARLNTLGRLALSLGGSALGVLVSQKVRDDRYVDGLWQTLEEADEVEGRFTEEMVADLPDPAKRFFLHAIRPGAPLASKLHWHYSGCIKPNAKMPWLSLAAEQILVRDRGFVWKARASKGPVFVTAADHYLDGDSRMRIALYGLLPVVNASGPDIGKSAQARLLIEGVALASAFLPGPRVKIEPVDDSHFRVIYDLHGLTTPFTIAVDADGRVKEITMQRWGNQTDDGSFTHIPYGAIMDEERTFGDYTIPTHIRVGWWYGTERYEDAIDMKVDWAYLW